MSRHGEGGKLSDAIKAPPLANWELLVRKHISLPCFHNCKQRIHKSKQTAVDEGHFYWISVYFLRLARRYRLPTSGTGLLQVRIPSEASDFCLRNFQTPSGAHLSSCSTSRWDTSPRGKRENSLRLTTNLHLTSTRICGAMPPILHTISWRVQGQLYLCLCSQYPTELAINIHSNRQSYGVRAFSNDQY